MIDTPPTRHSLLARLKEVAVRPEDWEGFLVLYTPPILAWCRNYGLQEADARDVTQNVLLRIARSIPQLEYDSRRSFRGWLRTIVHHCWCDWHETGGIGGTGTGDTGMLKLLQQVPARDELLARLERQYDQELLQLAMERVCERVEQQTWKVFELLALQGISGAEAARQTGMKVASAFAARSKVQRLVRTELAQLRAERGEAL
jgi:RNA polymerase sigma factor (sigma-70 family)